MPPLASRKRKRIISLWYCESSTVSPGGRRLVRTIVGVGIMVKKRNSGSENVEPARQSNCRQKQSNLAAAGRRQTDDLAGLNEQLRTEVEELRRQAVELHELKDQDQRAIRDWEWLARLAEENPDPVLRVSLYGVILYRNLASVPLCRQWNPDDELAVPPAVRKLVSAAYAGTESIHREMAFGEHTYLVTVAPAPAKYVNIYARDITERKRAEEVLKVKDAAIASSLNAIAMADLQGRLTYINPAFLRLWGYDEEQEVLGKSVLDFWEERDRALEVVQAIQKGGGWVGELVAVGKDGAHRNLYLSVSTVRDDEGAPVCIMASFVDITQRKQAEEARRQSEERLHLALGAARMGAWQWEVGTEHVEWSPELYALLGYESGRVTPTHQAFRQRIDPRDLSRWEQAVRESMERCEDYTCQFRVVWPDGSVHWVEARGQYGYTGGEHAAKTMWMRGVLADIEDRKQAEVALRERMKELGCLYAVSRDIQQGLSVEELCRRAVEHLIPAMQFPDITVPVIELKGRRFTSESYAEGLSDGLQAQIRVGGEVVGHLRVYYAQERPFLIPEEQDLVNGVAETLSVWLERKQAEQLLHESEEKFRVMADTSHASISLYQDSHLVYANRAAEIIFGYSLDERRHMSLLEFVHPDFQKSARERMKVLLEGGSAGSENEYKIIRKDGQERWVLSSSSRLTFGGKPAVLASSLDITERKQAEEAVRQSERQFRTTFENAAIGIAHVALDGHILQFNSRFCEIAGYLPDDILGKTCEQITFADDWEAERVQMRRLLDGQTDHYAIEKRYLRRDGSPVWVNLTRSIQRDDTGRPEHFIVIVEDISERKQAEQALRELTATLESRVTQRTAELRHRARQLQKLTLDMSEAEERERGRMAEILHDDLQQVLAAAKFQVGLMRSRAKYDAALQATAAETDHMLKDAIEKSRSLSHELSPAVLHHADFAETLRWLAGQVQAKHGLVVHVQAGGEIHLQSEALKGLLYRAAQELLFNVVKHARVNEAGIRVRRYRQWVCLAVSDRGRGFDPQELRETTGFGLLSIRERIGLLGGRMKIKSAKGMGSTFLIIVPEGLTVGVGPRAYPTPDRHEAQEGGHGGPPLRVLLADDHEIVREGLRSLLSDEHDVEVVGEAANGREAVDLASQLKPDVIIMDVSMPLIEGAAATRQIKACLPRARVIALSMHDQVEKIDAMYRAGAEDYVLKTAPSEELLAAIRGKERNL
jgi:PAS domain S-box-containing protein